MSGGAYAKTLSGRQKKNIVKFLPNFHQFFIDVHGIQIRWNFCEIFFRLKDRTFYLVFDFLTVHNNLKSLYSVIRIRLNFSISFSVQEIS